MKHLAKSLAIILSVVVPSLLCNASEFQWETATPESQGLSSEISPSLIATASETPPTMALAIEAV